MKHLLLQDEHTHPLPFYLAMEEVVARCCSGEEYFFTWVVQPTIIYGHNQVIENEVNLSFCEANNILTVKRKSGGGCVYADEGNIMMSYITPLNGDTVEDIFARYLQKIADSLRQIPLSEAMQGMMHTPTLHDLIHTSGRNDIMLGNKKISGNALYITPDKRHAIAHGTLLHSTDIERMTAAITPSTEKLAKNGVSSVRQRVTNLNKYTDISISDLRQHLAMTLCDSETTATTEMINEATHNSQH